MANTRPRNNSRARRLWLLLWLTPGVGFAASDWKVTSGLTVSERYSDNVSLVATGAQSAFITQISPRIAASRRGKRGSVDLVYSLNDLLYDSGQNNLTHDLNANMQLEPVTGVFKLNGSARVGQQYASQLAPTSPEAYHNVANRVGTRSVSLTPSLHNEFFERSLITDLSLALNHASSDSAVLNSSTSNTLKVSLRNGPRPGRLTYAGNYSRNNGDANGVPTSIFENESYNIGYVVYNKTRVFLSGGRNSTQGVTSLQGQGGRYLSGGVSWTPTHYYGLTASVGESGGSAVYGLSGNWQPSRKINLAATLGKRNNATSYSLSGNWTPDILTSLSASAQKNFDSNTFGVDAANNGLSAYGQTAYALKLSHRVRRAALGVSYSESVVNASQQLNQQFSDGVYRCGDDPANQQLTYIPPGQSVPANCQSATLNLTSLLNQTTFNKTWAGTINYSLGRSSLAFSLNQSRRQYLGTAGGGSDKQTGVTASWSLPISGRTRTTLGMNWNTAEAATLESDTWSINWSLAHQISPRVSSSFSARHSEQKTNGALGNIKENSVSAQLGMTF
ncbi:MAG: TIGR03016 family PEP-CTERM system-associated outer membrane protein [Pseudomonadota bacterium]|nr:TIGR03016 family PEP-CTERM system-associated outer membrane protein [Pseudomonadota bacterium]MDP1903282.1 TIGR03016 family PEP-CTERM system-associated outer membrane protein [Pseudomonadota bacterium]MDP2353394.1 TIGR03016 family PEP-CTERM system-associated outer membrane protein [Pseudomonadota bacterium]